MSCTKRRNCALCRWFVVVLCLIVRQSVVVSATQSRRDSRLSLRLGPDGASSCDDADETLSTGPWRVSQASVEGDNDNNNDENNDHPGLLRTLRSIVAALLPSPRRLSDRSDSDLIRKEASVGLNEIFEKAPKPLRIVGNFLNPFFTRAMTSTSSSSSPTSLVNHYLRQAQDLLSRNQDVLDLLGSPLLIAPTPFVEKTSVSMRKPSNQFGDALEESEPVPVTHLELSFTVSGSREAGVAYLSASTDQGILLLRVTTSKGHKSVDVPVPTTNNKSLEPGWLIVTTATTATGKELN